MKEVDVFFFFFFSPIFKLAVPSRDEGREKNENVMKCEM